MKWLVHMEILMHNMQTDDIFQEDTESKDNEERNLVVLWFRESSRLGLSSCLAELHLTTRVDAWLIIKFDFSVFMVDLLWMKWFEFRRISCGHEFNAVGSAAAED